MRSAHRLSRWLWPLASLTLVTAVSACGAGSSTSTSSSSSTGAKDELSSIAFANARDADPQLKRVGDTLQRLAEADGIAFDRFDNKFDPGATLQNARLIVQKSPQVAVEWSAVADANKAVGEQFARAKLPCVAMSVAIPGCALINQDNAKGGADAGAYAASVAKKKGWTGANTTLLLINAPFIGPELNKLVTNFYVGYAKAFPDMKQVEASQITPTTTSIGGLDAVIVDGKGELQATNKAVQQALARIPDDRHLVVGAMINDDSGLGALRALQQAGRADDAMIVSAGADPNGLKQLRTNPNWVADVSVFFEVWPKYVLPMAKAMAAGAKMPAVTQAPQLVLTKDNVDEYYDAEGNVIKDPPIPAASAYLEAHGLR